MVKRSLPLASPLAMAERNALRQRREDRAREVILTATQWLSAEHLAAVAKVEVDTIELWTTEKKNFAIYHNERALYPQYAFDENMHPFPVIAQVQGIFADFSSLSLAAWFESTSSFLRGKRPRELVARAPDQVLAWAANTREMELHFG